MDSEPSLVEDDGPLERHHDASFEATGLILDTVRSTMSEAFSEGEVVFSDGEL